MKKAVIAALAGLLLLTVAACGSSKHTLSAEEKKVAANIAKSFTAESSGALSTKESTCFADDFVGKVGVPKLKAAKLIDANGQLNQASAKFDTTLATQFAQSFLGCVDYQKRQAQVIASADPKVDATKLEACLKTAMPKDYVTKLIVASYTQSSTTTSLISDSTKKLQDCKTKATSK